MINKSFLNTISVLYVEDEDLAREKLGGLLKKLFKSVDLARNGQEGFEKFKASIDNKKNYDLILSDINMPIMNGIDMLEKIRQLDSEVPFIFTTARSESENLLKAIELNANHYVLKPIDIQNLILKSQAVCEKNFLRSQLVSKQKEMENFLEAINNVAAVYIFNNQGEITYVNEAFIEATEFSKEEIVGKKLEQIFHEEVSKSILSTLWEKVNSNEILETIIRYENKSNKDLYFSAAVFKLSGDTQEYISIGFESTEDVIQKKDFNKKVMKSFQDFNKKEQTYKHTIDDLKTKLLQYQNALIKLQKDLQYEKKKNIEKESQLAAYDSKALTSKDKKHDILEQKNKEIQTHIKNNRTLKNRNDDLEERIVFLEKELQRKDKQIESSKEKFSEKLREIKELQAKIKT